MPEWRKELSERVREVQEKRAREAAREAAEAERQRVEAAINPPQLELLPPAQLPAMNPLVVAALKRIERAHQPAPAEHRQSRTSLATAVAYAPEREENDMSETVSPDQQLAFEPEITVAEPPPPPVVEKPHHLAVVPVSEPVVEKIARVVEEVVIGKEATQRTEKIDDTVRRTDVEVEQLSGGTRKYADDDFRTHWNSNYAQSGETYEDYAPAYQYGTSIGADERYRGKSWADIESNVQSDWESRYPKSGWQKFKDAVRHGWEKVTS